MPLSVGHLNLGIPDFVKRIFRRFFWPLLILLIVLLPGSILHLVPEYRLSHSSRELIGHISKVKKMAISKGTSIALITAYKGENRRIVILNSCPKVDSHEIELTPEDVVFDGPIDEKYPDVRLKGGGISGEVIQSDILCYDSKSGFSLNGEPIDEFFLTLSTDKPKFLGENKSNKLRLTSQIHISGSSNSLSYKLL